MILNIENIFLFFYTSDYATTSSITVIVKKDICSSKFEDQI